MFDLKLPQLASLFGEFVQLLLRWVGHLLCLILTQMHLHRSLRKAHCMIQTLKGTLYVCIDTKGCDKGSVFDFQQMRLHWDSIEEDKKRTKTLNEVIIRNLLYSMSAIGPPELK